MNPGLLTCPMVDILYPGRVKDMSNFLDQEWPTSGQTPYTTFSTPFEYAPAIVLPHHGSGYFHARTNPATFNNHVQDPVYTGVTGAAMRDAAGLGISNSANYPSISSTASSYSPKHSVPAQSNYNESRNAGKRRSLRHATPPTPDTAGLPPILQSQTFTPLPTAPYPSAQQARQTKRLCETDQYDSGRSPQRRRSTSTGQSQTQLIAQVIERRQQVELTEEEQYLFKLKQEENLPWKDICQEFEQQFGRTYQVPALQMRFKRLKERLRTWTDSDVEALEAAHEYWEKQKFDIIAAKMLEFGAQEKWPAKHCERKWEELHPNPSIRNTTTPAPYHSIPLRPAPVPSASSERWIPHETNEMGFIGSPLPTFMSKSPGPFTTSIMSRSPMPRSPRQPFKQ